MADRGLKRVCASCSTKFYDLSKLPIVCPSCKAEFTGEVRVKTRRARSAIIPDTVKRADIEEKNAIIIDDEDPDTISLDDLDEGDKDDDDDLGIDDIDTDDDDFEGLEGDINVDIDAEDDR